MPCATFFHANKFKLRRYPQPQTVRPSRLKRRGIGDPLVITITPATATLIPVTDRGNVYMPPIEHQGIHLADASPLAIAELGISYLRNMFSEAKELL